MSGTPDAASEMVERVLRHIPRQHYVINPGDDLDRRDAARRIVRDLMPLVERDKAQAVKDALDALDATVSAWQWKQVPPRLFLDLIADLRDRSGQ